MLIESIAASNADNWQIAFRKHSDEHRNHEATDRIIECLKRADGHDALIGRLLSEQQTHIRQCQDALSRQIEDCRNNVESGVALGLVGDRERAELLQVVERIHGSISSIRNFGEAEVELAKINTAIAQSRMTQVDQVRRRLELEMISTEHPAYNRIESVLTKGDIDTANEYSVLPARLRDFS
jgi:hypothetical protein